MKILLRIYFGLGFMFSLIILIIPTIIWWVFSGKDVLSPIIDYWSNHIRNL